MHIIHLIRRRFPNQAGGIIVALALVSAAAAVMGVGVLLLQDAAR
jgi:hypothetical protein